MPSQSSSRRLKSDARAIFEAGLRSANAGEAIKRHIRIARSSLYAGKKVLDLRQFDRVFVVGAGKAAAAMGVALEDVVGPERILGGVLNVKFGHNKPTPKLLTLYQCGHPVPDETGEKGALAIETILRQLTARDLLFVLISGGASALLPAPAPPVTLRDKQSITDQLLMRGADIFDLNSVRKHLSRLKGGLLASLAYPATVVALILSDVIGDPLDVIGSGLTAPDESSFGDALRVLSKFGLKAKAPRSVMARLEEGALGRIPETPKPGDPVFAHVHNVLVGSNRLALEAASRQAKQLGYRTVVLSSSMHGETREVAKTHAEILREIIKGTGLARKPACLLSGGETTVKVLGKGKGGRNQEFALAAAIQLNGEKNWAVLSGGTDGTDGPTDAAGAFADATTGSRALVAGLSALAHLGENDAYPFFDQLGDLVKTGPTGTNVMDLHILLAD
ncbi:MAG TPA: glycerate kinase [Bryobacteraceae bacterium]|nr:glycerate kinase [Bryobacteraceae bacterium]